MRRFLVNINSKKKYIINNDRLKKMCFAHNDNSWLVSYLEKADFLNIVMDKSVCVFSGVHIDHYQTIRTDGVWVWSSDLLFYTKNFNFQWTEDFIRHASDNLGAINKITDENYRFFETNFNYIALEIMADNDLE